MLPLAANNACLSHGLANLGCRLVMPLTRQLMAICRGVTARSLKGKKAFLRAFGFNFKDFSATRWFGLMEAALANFTDSRPFAVRWSALELLADDPDVSESRRTALTKLLCDDANFDAVEQAAAAGGSDDEDPQGWEKQQRQRMKKVTKKLSPRKRLAIELALLNDIGSALQRICYAVESDGFTLPLVTTYMDSLEPIAIDAVNELEEKQVSEKLPSLATIVSAEAYETTRRMLKYAFAATEQLPDYYVTFTNKDEYSTIMALARLAVVLYPLSEVVAVAVGMPPPAVYTDLLRKLDLVKQIKVFRLRSLTLPYNTAQDLHEALVENLDRLT